MTRRAGLGDLARVRALAPRGVSFDLEGDVVLGRSALRCALATALGRGRDLTLVLRPGATGSPAGFIQARRRADGVAADLVRLAPSLTANAAALTWQRLVADACQALGARGVRRVYVAVAADDALARRLFERAGFNACGSDLVYRRGPEAAPAAGGAAAAPAPVAPDEAYAAARLAAAGRPERARRIDGPEDDWATYPAGGHWPRGRMASGVARRADGAVAGAWRVVRGPGGAWVHAVTGDGAAAPAALDAALAAVPGGVAWCAERDDAPGLGAALAARGFAPWIARHRLVKHTTRRLVAPVWRESAAAGAVSSPPVAPARAGGGGPLAHRL